MGAGLIGAMRINAMCGPIGYPQGSIVRVSEPKWE